MKGDGKAARKGGTAVALTLAASLIYGLSGGIRANYGILLGPISANSGVDYASCSFVIAVAQLVFGIMQPVFGALALKKSNGFVLRCGVDLMTGGLLTIPFCHSLWLLLLVLGIVLPSGTAALSFGIVMGLITPKLPERAASTASGVVTSSCGVGSTVLSPVLQALTAGVGLMGAMFFLGVPSLLLLPVSLFLCRTAADGGQRRTGEQLHLKELVGQAAQSRDYRFLLMGFFTCGFHMAIIETHLVTQITTYGFSEQMAAYAFSAYGIATMVGSVVSGILCGRFPMQCVLGGLYGSRVVMVLLFLILPKTPATIFGFAILLGLTGNATVPPTSGLTERLFGAAKLATLFGVIFFSHQIGSFFSAWLGGICMSVTGGYTLIWLVDVALSGMASFVSFKIRKGNGENEAVCS